jgi:hypothetical protein
MSYNLYCLQRGEYYPAGEKKNFVSLKQIRKELIIYHSIDNETEELNKLSLKDILNIFNWRVDKKYKKC